MSKGLDALESLVETMPFALIETNSMKYVKIIEKELKALEIIKNKLINVHDLYVYKTFASFNQRRTLKGLLPIPQEEYDLLKEILL